MGNVKPQIDARTDLFAVGVVLYEALYGQNPFYEGKRDQIEVIQHMTRRDLAPLDIAGDTTGRFSEFIQSLVSRFPSRRPQTAREALSWFEELEAGYADQDRN
jgi:eukaryotic-like serine/threonine-protein kinase